MLLLGIAPSFQRLFARQVKPSRRWFEIKRPFRATNQSMTSQIQAKLQAVGTKTARPFKFTGQINLLPFDADAQVQKPSVKALPAITNRQLSGWFFRP
jgi:hypothetical protein